jgi:hypothetical protein
MKTKEIENKLEMKKSDCYIDNLVEAFLHVKKTHYTFDSKIILRSLRHILSLF